MEIFQIIGLALVATVIALLLKATDPRWLYRSAWLRE